MLEQARRFVDLLEQNPPPIAGSGFQWIVDSKVTSERLANDALVNSLPLAIENEEIPGGLEQILEQILDKGARRSTNDNAPGYMAYVPSGGLFHSAVADFLGTAMNRYVTIDQAAPVFAAIEKECVKWMCMELAGWTHASCGGVLTSGGSFANLLALHAAKSSKISSVQLAHATVYVSEQAHYCVAMGARFIGVPPSNVRKVPSVSKDLSMCLDSLKQFIRADVERGLIPIAVAAMAGTTNSGAVDDLEGIAQICKENKIWFHVDGAYGGFFAMTEEGRAVLKGIEKADSIVTDPHKGLFLPYGLGALLVREQFSLQRGNRSDGSCMQPPAEGEDAVEDIMNLSPELTRSFRGLKMWLPLRMLGADKFRAHLNEKLALTKHAAAAIESASVPNLRIVSPPTLSIFTFKLDDGVLTGDALDALNADFLNRIHSRGNVLLSPFRSVHGTPGELCIRMAILSHRTDLHAVDTAIADIHAAALAAQGLGHETGIFRDSRAHFRVSALEDFVKDYRELVRLPVWDTILTGDLQEKRVLDVCAGTGRWAQAFSELVVKDRQVKCDFVDLCSDSTSVLDGRRSHMPNLSGGQVFTGDICALDQLGVPALSYDVITNMHGLYGVPGARLSSALQTMYDALKPGGTMILAIGAEHSAYQEVAKECFGISFTTDTEIMDALTSLGIQFTGTHINYIEEFSESDEAGLERFLLDECGGNTFPTDTAAEKVDPKCFTKDYARSRFDEASRTFRFPQKISVITVSRNAGFLPEMQSFGKFYSEAYTLRRQASTMQRNMIAWLRRNGEQNILNKLSSNSVRPNGPFRIASIGCGDGELDLALMEGIAHSVEKWGYSGIEFTGLEPSETFRQKFTENLAAARERGHFPPPEHTVVNLVDNTFDHLKTCAVGEGEADLVLLGHVMYYFSRKEEALKKAMQIARPGGLTVVIHQGKEGIPELQEQLLPTLRGSIRDMFTADDVDNILATGKVDRFVRHNVDAFLDISEIVKGSEDGVKIMSFCLEADHRLASKTVLEASRDAFVDRAVVKGEVGRTGGPFLLETVSCFVVPSQSAQQ